MDGCPRAARRGQPGAKVKCRYPERPRKQPHSPFPMQRVHVHHVAAAVPTPGREGAPAAVAGQLLATSSAAGKLHQGLGCCPSILHGKKRLAKGEEPVATLNQDLGCCAFILHHKTQLGKFETLGKIDLDMCCHSCILHSAVNIATQIKYIVAPCLKKGTSIAGALVQASEFIRSCAGYRGGILVGFYICIFQG